MKEKKGKRNSVNIYGIASFVMMIMFLITTLLFDKAEEGTKIYAILKGISLVGLVISLVFAINALCIRLKDNDYGAILSIISIIIVSGLLVVMFIVKEEVPTNEEPILDNAIKCAKVKKCSSYSNGIYTCDDEKGNQITCKAKWFDYFND